jgi:peptidyl-prolyl cis-trans isomerase C
MAAFLLLSSTIFGCGSKDEKTAGESKPVMAPTAVPEQPPASATKDVPLASASQKPDDGSGTAVEVDGVKLSKVRLEQEINEKMKALKDQIPKESQERAKGEIRKVLIDEFIVQTLLKGEISRKKAAATDKEVDEVLDAMKAQLPKGMTMDDIYKKNNLDAKKMREDIGMNIALNKLVMAELGGKVKVTDQEISDFYNKNIDQFKKPEAVHARHILVAVEKGANDKVKAEKKAKADDLRKQLVNGADFAALAAKSSDCPSKQNGGDLGFFPRGQMVKSFDDAAFAQQTNAIGPVVETQFGYHIIQVVERRSAQTIKLEGKPSSRYPLSCKTRNRKRRSKAS